MTHFASETNTYEAELTSSDVRSGVMKSWLPCLLLDARGRVAAVSQAGVGLQHLWDEQPLELCDGVRAVQDSGVPQDVRIESRSGNRYRVLLCPTPSLFDGRPNAPQHAQASQKTDTTTQQTEVASPSNASALAAPPTRAFGVLLAAYDTTVFDKVTEALVKSRTLLRRLLETGTSLAFELDERGCFRFVSPDVAFGQDMTSWLGLPAKDFFWSNGDAPLRLPIEADKRGRFESIEVSMPGRSSMFLDFDVHPPTGPDAEKRFGLLASCRDVTEHVLSERKAKAISRRLLVQNRITQVLNEATSAQDVLVKAAEIMRDLLRAECVWILTADDFSAQASDIGEPHAPNRRQSGAPYEVGRPQLSEHYNLRVACVLGEETEPLPYEDLILALVGAQAGELRTLEMGSAIGISEAMAVVLGTKTKDRGVMVIYRDTMNSPWSNSECDLLKAVGGTLTAALSKAQLFDQIYKLSSQDTLTGLLNRRALIEAIEQRLRHSARTGRTGALLFLDLDHFKDVNDKLGHSAGDKAIKQTAKRLMGAVRASDEVGRYGGDEFIVWLDEITQEQAEAKARSFINMVEDVRQQFGRPDVRLGASVGVAMNVPGFDFDFDSLADRADRALYEVKASGRGRIAVAPLPGAAQAKTSPANSPEINPEISSGTSQPSTLSDEP